MNRAERIKTAVDRGVKALKLKPAVGQGTAVTKVEITDGMTCKVTDGDWSFVVDMPEKHGGDNKGPNSGIVGRAALGTCLAVGYVRWAAMLDIPITSLNVDVEADYDVRGELGVDDVPPRYGQMRYTVRVESSAPEEKVRQMIERADALSPWLDMLVNPVNVARNIECVPSSEEVGHDS
jgi:uncharacterized OsmC-like protein